MLKERATSIEGKLDYSLFTLNVVLIFDLKA
jgi:hypothetical protein